MRILLLALLLFLSLSVFAAQPPDLVLILKGERKLQVIAGNRVLREFPIVLGGNPIGHKTQEGDGKTPEGTYSLDYKKADSAFYKAIHISYPNENDAASARVRGVSPGGQIMIHGQKNGLGWLSFISQRFDWTNGCVALSNENMDALWLLVREGTKVEIKP